MATVYLARGPGPAPHSVRDLTALPVEAGDPSAQRLAALKRPHPHLVRDPVYVSMLLDEARLASAIKHPNVVRVRELGFENELPFVVMDYVEGTSLVEVRRELAEAGRALDVPVALRIALDALAGLQAAHELCDETGRPLGIIHRDVSPHNVLVGSDGIARLTDFGIAKAEDRVQVTRTHEVKGKLAYMAPERVDSRRICTVQSDVFSMGVVLWESLAGRRLFRGDEPVHVLEAVLHASIPRLRSVGAVHVPEALDEVIARALSRDLSVRYATAAEFAVALQGHGLPLGRREDVARVVDTVFAPKLRVLHEAIRRAVGPEQAERLLVASGLAPRPRPSPSMSLSTPEIFGAIGTAVPSDRYVLGDVAEPPPKRKQPVAPFLAVAGGVLILGTALTILALRLGRTHVAAPLGSPASSSLAASTTPIASTRRITLMLPFAASHVALGDEEHSLSPPAETAFFEVPLESGNRHHVRAVADDGTSAEGTFVEEDGFARADAAVVVQRPASIDRATPPSGGRRPKGKNDVGTRRDGFTKLK
jgi:serine/threonine-protein kinase